MPPPKMQAREQFPGVPVQAVSTSRPQCHPPRVQPNHPVEKVGRQLEGSWKAKYDQIPEDTKDPKLREMKKKMKKKAPTRRSTEQYWSEEQFWKLKDMLPGRLASWGTIPWRLLAHIITLDSDIEPIRKMVGRRLMSDKWVKEGQKQLDDMLTALHQSGFITLMREDGTEWQDLAAM